MILGPFAILLSYVYCCKNNLIDILMVVIWIAERCLGKLVTFQACDFI